MSGRGMHHILALSPSWSNSNADAWVMTAVQLHWYLFSKFRSNSSPVYELKRRIYPCLIKIKIKQENGKEEGQGLCGSSQIIFMSSKMIKK